MGGQFFWKEENVILGAFGLDARFIKMACDENGAFCNFFSALDNNGDFLCVKKTTILLNF